MKDELIRFITIVVITVVLIHLYQEKLANFSFSFSFYLFFLCFLLVFFHNFLYTIRLKYSNYKSFKRRHWLDLTAYLYLVNLVSFIIPLRLGDILLLRIRHYNSISIKDNYHSFLKIKIIDLIIVFPVIFFFTFDQTITIIFPILYLSGVFLIIKKSNLKIFDFWLGLIACMIKMMIIFIIFGILYSDDRITLTLLYVINLTIPVFNALVLSSGDYIIASMINKTSLLESLMHIRIYMCISMVIAVVLYSLYFLTVKKKKISA